MFKTLATVTGIVFVVIGILGFIPAFAPVDENGMAHLFGLFMVGTLHNIIHIASGVAALAAGAVSERYAKLYFQVFGIVYALVALIGFIQGNTVLGIFPVNMADNFLHLFLAVALGGIGFGVREQPKTALEQ